MKRHVLIAALAAATTLGCAASRSASFETPEQAGQAILVALAEGRDADAARIHDAIASDPHDREHLYPVLYESARGRYEAGEPESAARVLEFLVERHPAAVASREALVYALFLQRAELEVPDPTLNQRLEAAIDGLRASSPATPAWLELVETQLAIDAGRLDAARTSYDTFLGRWDGEPAALLVYVEDLGRYLASH